jgi:hypothetical protein
MHRFKRTRAPLHETFHPHLFTIKGATDALYSFKKIKQMLNNKILTLTITALIAGVESQATCTSSSPQCCWVVRSWQLMGRTIPAGISSTDNSCCTVPMANVTCDSSNRVIKLLWVSKGLSGSIPAAIGNLINLQQL